MRLAVDGELSCKRRDPYVKNHIRITLSLDDVSEAVSERIHSLKRNLDRHIVPNSFYFGRNRYGAYHARIAFHERTESELWPALTEICRTAAVSRFESEHMGLRAVCAEMRSAGERRAIYLVYHLHVLVCPHILGYCCGERVECCFFKTLCPYRVACIRIYLFERIHKLHYRAKLCSLGGTDARKTLVSRERSDGSAVVLVENGKEVLGSTFWLFIEKRAAENLRFYHHAEIHYVCFIRPFVERRFPPFLQFAVIDSFCAEHICQLVEPRLGTHFFEHYERRESLKPAEIAPRAERNVSV